MIELGCFDPGVSDAACSAYCKEVEQITRLPLASVQAGLDKIVTKPLAATPGLMSIAQVQQALKTIGFFPGGDVDGICGYRTQSAIRLFQEYVRSIEKIDCLPDGRFGPQTQIQLQRWLDGALRPAWGGSNGEYEAWLALLAAAQQQYIAQPTRATQLVNSFSGASDTRKPTDWDVTGPGHIHLVGIRRNEASGKFDDVIVLLIKGLVFKFQGTTEPGAGDNPLGLPFLVPGQHEYHFGWHKSSYLALRPASRGVLIVRTGPDKKLDDADLDRGLEANTTINVHWGGRGLTGDVKTWSEGCQVITGSVYLNAADTLVSCTAFAAVTPADASTPTGKTRGAYNLLVDLITAFGSDLPGSTVKYTLLTEADLALAPTLAQGLADARSRVVKLVAG